MMGGGEHGALLVPMEAVRLRTAELKAAEGFVLKNESRMPTYFPHTPSVFSRTK